MKREINMRRAPLSDKGKRINIPADMSEDGKIITDPNGSYTGVPIGWEHGEQPVQDVDDL